MSCNCHPKCGLAKFAWLLVIIGALNWGLIGLGTLFGGNGWNVVHMIFGSMPTLEAVVYLLVGIGAIVKIFGCPCKKCKEAQCASCAVADEIKM